MEGVTQWPTPGISLIYFPWQLAFVCPIMTILTIWTAAGNGMVILAVFRCQKLRSLSNFLIANLALSDLLLAVTVMPLTATTHMTGVWLFGFFCDIWLSVDVLWCTASVWNLVVIAVDRFTATNYPVWYRHRKKDLWTGIYIISVWGLAIIVTLPGMINLGGEKQSLEFNNSTGHYDCVLYKDKRYVIYSAIGSFILPLFIMLVLYARIFTVLSERGRTLREKQEAKRSALNNTTHRNQTNSIEPQETAIDDGNSGLYTGHQFAMIDDEAGIEDSTVAVQQLIQNTNDSIGNGKQFNGITKKNKRKLLDVKPGHIMSKSKKNYTQSLPSLKSEDLHGGTEQEKEAVRADRRERRATKHMALIIFFFVLCWIPFTLFYLIRSLIEDKRTDEYLFHLEVFLYWLGYANSALNPVLYAILNKDFKMAFANILRCRNL